MLTQAFTITPHDVNPVDAHEAIYVGGAGDLTVVTRKTDGQGGFIDTQVVLTGLTAGRLLPISVYKVMTASTATALVGWR